MDIMNFTEFSKKIANIGREINLDTIVETRKLVTSLQDTTPCNEVKLHRDISYGEDPRHRLDVFTSSTHDGEERPLLIFVHGGGFVAGDKHTPDTPFYDNVGIWAVKNGFNAINITYRLAPQNKWPSGIEDIHQAIQWVRKSGGEYGLSNAKIILMGQSAGAAHVAGYVSHPEIYAPDGHGLAGVVFLSGVYDFTTMRVSELEKAYLGDDESNYGERSSMAGLIKSDLPMLVTASEFDPHFFEAQALDLLTAIQKQDMQMPKFVHMIGHNHISVVLTLGLEGDLLAPQLKSFIDLNAR